MMVNDDFWWKSMVLEGWNQIASCSTEALDQHDLELTKHLTICCINPIGVNMKSRKPALSIQTGLSYIITDVSGNTPNACPHLIKLDSLQYDG